MHGACKRVDSAASAGQGETNHPASVKECRRAFLHGWMVLQRHEGGNVPSRALSARFAAFLRLFFFQFEAAAPRTPLAESYPACPWHAVISFHIQLFLFTKFINKESVFKNGKDTNVSKRQR